MANELLNNVDHHDLRVITRHGAEHGDGINQVMVFPTEFEGLQREYPILFRRDGEGALRPVALLGLDRDENLFLDGAGGWRARQVPVLQQRGPFSIAAPSTPDGEPMIRIDTAHPRVSRSEGEPLFLPHGGNTPYLDHMSAVLQAIYIGHHLLAPMAAAFEQAGLLRPVNLEARVGESDIYTVSEVFTIDRERLAALGGDELAALHRAGFLQSAFHVVASLANFTRLIELKQARTAG
ncbi:SapC family protein [Sphingomonas canadensis]|uniref:SapC family protein n=1 Tax=Sphingomonas canadensis TaxID=1219257 RepID=A0ABW3H955_9SPHN|nr:SapC family protein [Sphingomonas canadensis]MCW3837699.1 SapC family protein [Sphingomonas canadensis]